MTTRARHCRTGLGGRNFLLSVGRRARGCKSWRNDDRGQAMLLVLAVIAILTLFPLIIANEVNSEFPLLSHEVQTQQAQAAAEAGIQHYRNLLDNVPNYWSYSATNLPQNATPPLPADPAFTGWNTVTAGSNQAYHYIPNTSCILSSNCITGPNNGDVVLTVTGRAGSHGRYSYESLTATFKLSGILNDAYYSEYELLDPNVPGSYPTATYCTINPGFGGCPGADTVTVSETAIYPTGNYSQMVIPIASLNNSLFMDLCGYHTFEPNAYIDSLDSISGPGGVYSSSHPYYGPFGVYDASNLNSSSFTLAAGASGNPTNGTSHQQSLTFNAPCNQGFNFKAGESFNGTVYTNDQIYTDTSGGSPAFNGTPPIDTGAKNNLNYCYLWDWPGSATRGSGASTCYYPQGWIETAGGAPTGLSYANEGRRISSYHSSTRPSAPKPTVSSETAVSSPVRR